MNFRLESVKKFFATQPPRITIQIAATKFDDKH